jgi:HAD superfamily hydrolase (TIGR01509 family)
MYPMCNLKPKIKTVFFDMDGTVLDTEPIHTLAIEKALTELGIKDGINFPARCIGISNAKMKALFINELGSGEDYDKTISLAIKHAEEHKAVHGIKLKTSFTELIEFLAESDIKSYIVTSTFRKGALQDLKQADIYKYFDGFVCGGDYKHSKPHPEPYLTALKLSGENAENCIAIEDSAAGLTSATSAGLRCVLVRDMAEVPPVAAELACADLKSLSDVINLIM